MGPSICESRYHLGVMRSTLNRNLGKLLPELVDEIVTAFPEELGSTMSKGALFATFPVPRSDEGWK